MNNIGGIIQCEILGVEDIEVFALVNQTAQIRIKKADAWRKLPISLKKTTASATPSAGNAGTLYEHKFNSLLPAGCISKTDASRYRSLCICGCIIRYTDANGNQRILGTKEYPLTGTLAEVPGESATVLAGYELSLKASELTPQLACVEI